MTDNTCYIERSKVREILITSNVNNEDTKDLLREIDALTIFVAADFCAQPQSPPELTAVRKEADHLRAGLESIVNCRNPLTRAAVREACAEILAAGPSDTSTDRPMEDDCSCGGGDISGHDTQCPYYSVSSPERGGK